jgi:hypothetical protein
MYPPSILLWYYDYPIDSLSGCQDVRNKGLTLLRISGGQRREQARLAVRRAASDSQRMEIRSYAASFQSGNVPIRRMKALFQTWASFHGFAAASDNVFCVDYA